MYTHTGGTVPPISLTKDKQMIRYLLQHGANPQNAYSHYRQVLGNVFSKEPLNSPVKMLVIGHGGEGKSTLIEAMKIEPTRLTSFKNIFVSPKEVKGVSQKTAGIIPQKLNSRIFGEVKVYDFAGQEAYYSSHAAVIKTAVDTCQPILTLVVDLNKNDDAGIASSVSYWLGIIANQCTNMEGKAPLIVVGSHADMLSDESILQAKKEIIMQAVRKFSLFELVEIIPMDCRYSNSNGMTALRQCVASTCDNLRSNLSVSLNCHMSLVYLLDKFREKIALSLKELQQEIQLDSAQPSEKHENIVEFIPTTITHLVDVCVQLSDKGHILFLPNTTSPEKSFIILDSSALLSQINGTIFAPDDFKQHIKLSTSTGIVPLSRLAAFLRERNIDIDLEVAVGFLSHLELAVPIDDKAVLNLLDQHLSSADVSESGGFVFAPALIRLEALSETIAAAVNFVCKFVWSLACTHNDHFFNPRFLHVLLLRLALSLGLAPVTDTDIPALQGQCSVWKTGVCWVTEDGIRVHVEILEKKRVIVEIDAPKLSIEVLQLRSTIIEMVIKAASDFCPNIDTQELLISSENNTSLFSLKSVATSISQEKEYVKSTVSTQVVQVKKLLPAEVYADLGVNILSALFNENDLTHDKKLSDRFILALSHSWNKNRELADIVCLAVTKNCKSVPGVERGVEHVLKKWRDSGEGTCRALRVVLDPLSVFTGKNLLVSSLIHTHLLSHAHS